MTLTKASYSRGARTVLATESLRCALHGGRLGRLLGAEATLQRTPRQRAQRAQAASRVVRGASCVVGVFGSRDRLGEPRVHRGAERGRAGVV